MGTRSNIYIETEPGTYIGTYCHFDGYPSHMFPILESMANDELQSHILIAMTQGGIRVMDNVATEYIGDTSSTVILTDPHMEDWGPDYIWIKCHDGSVKWRYSSDDRWRLTQDE